MGSLGVAARGGNARWEGFPQGSCLLAWCEYREWGWDGDMR